MQKGVSSGKSGKGKGSLLDILGDGLSAGFGSFKGMVKGSRSSPSASPHDSPDGSPRASPARLPKDATNIGSAPTAEDVDWETASASTAATKGYSAMMLLPILMIHATVRLRECKMCGEACDCQSPLSASDPGDRYGGWIPWQQYMAAQISGFRCVKGDICNICYLVYKELGTFLKLLR